MIPEVVILNSKHTQDSRSPTYPCDEYWLSSPRNLFVEDDEEHDEDADGVEEAVPAERPPVEVGGGAGEQGAHGDDEHDVEDGRADDAGHSDVILGEEHADDDGGELRSGGSGGHERRAGHVWRQLQLCNSTEAIRGTETRRRYESPVFALWLSGLW